MFKSKRLNVRYLDNFIKLWALRWFSEDSSKDIRKQVLHCGLHSPYLDSFRGKTSPVDSDRAVRICLRAKQ